MALSYPAFAVNTRVQQAARNAPAFRMGEKGSGVKTLQAALIQLGYPMPVSVRRTGLPDGIYGQETKKIVLKFQEAGKLKGKDGIAGKETLTKLDQLLTAVTPPPPPSPPPPIPPPSTRDYELGTGDPSITPDAGAGPWNSSPKTIEARVQQEAILEILPYARAYPGPDAVRHMYHYMGNDGKTLTIDLEGMIASVPSAKARFLNEVSQAKKFVELLSAGTYMIRSRMPEGGYNGQKESANWYFAVGGYSTWGSGKATVSGANGSRQFELEFDYKFYDRYNWDKGKQVTIVGITITDHFMGEFHRQGLAQEFDMTASVRRNFRWTEGTPIPAEQYEPPGGR